MKVLLTGGSGFIAMHCLQCLLERGHTVVITVRSNDKGARLLETYADAAQEQLFYIVVEDIAAPGAFDEAVQSNPPFDAVIHTASPFHYNVVDAQTDLIDPAVNGTMSILQAVHKYAPTVKRIVITSSFASIINPEQHPAVYDESIWNPVTADKINDDAATAYRASKTFAEKAAWKFVQDEKPDFTISTINPPSVFGPIFHYDRPQKANINTSNARFQDMLQGKMSHTLAPTGAFLWVDVRDVALAHVKAAELPEAGGKRFFVTEGHFSNADIANIIKEEFPEYKDRFPTEIKSDVPDDVYGFDSGRSREVLGIRYRGLRECVVDTVKSLADGITSDIIT